MFTSLCKAGVSYLFQRAGIVVGKDIIVADDSFYYDVAVKGSLGLGEGFVSGKWTTPDLVSTIRKLSDSPLLTKVQYWLGWLYPLQWLKSLVLLVLGQTRAEAREVGSQHYDLSTAMYENMLGKPMIYSCGYWKGVDTLEDAQNQKMDLLCRKLQLKPGQSVLEIGCGWGDFAIYMANNYGVTVVGLTISENQRLTAEKRAKLAGVEDKVVFLLEDYRDHTLKYDRIVSVGMLEHVSSSMLSTYFQQVHDLLLTGGLAVIHSITKKQSTSIRDPWISKYIFPNSAIPSNSSWVSALNHVALEIEDVQNIGPDYAKTLHAWYDRYTRFCDMVSSENGRMWQFYLNCCEAQFLSRNLNVWQMVLSKQRLERYDASR